jgi:hypothetical protein
MLVDVGYASSHAALFRVGSAAHGVEMPTVEQLGESTIADGLGVAAVDDILFDSIALKLKEKGECSLPLPSVTSTVVCPHTCMHAVYGQDVSAVTSSRLFAQACTR